MTPMKSQCPLYPQKRTYRPAISGRAGLEHPSGSVTPLAKSVTVRTGGRAVFDRTNCRPKPAVWRHDTRTHAIGLLDQRSGWFGFRDLASARQIAKLLADGVRLSEIICAVSQIRKWLPDVGLANVRLHAGPHYSLEVEQPGGRTDQHGQFVLAVDRSLKFR